MVSLDLQNLSIKELKKIKKQSKIKLNKEFAKFIEQKEKQKLIDEIYEIENKRERIVIAKRKLKEKSKAKEKIRKQTLREKEQEIEDYEYVQCMQENYDKIFYDLSIFENEKNYGYSMDDEELRNFIDNEFFELQDNYERYGIKDLLNSEIKEDEKEKYFIVEECDEFAYGEYLEEKPINPKSLQDIAKRNIIKKTSDSKKKMKLLELYDNERDFYLTAADT